jgi:hypothetical protein
LISICRPAHTNHQVRQVQGLESTIRKPATSLLEILHWPPE